MTDDPQSPFGALCPPGLRLARASPEALPVVRGRNLQHLTDTTPYKARLSLPHDLKNPPSKCKRPNSCERRVRPLGFLGDVVHKGTATRCPQRLLWLLPQPFKSSAASLPASPYRGAEGLGHAGGPGQLSGPSHRKRSRRADRKWGRAARPSGSICAPGHNGRALPLGSMDLSVGRLHAVSLKSRFGGLRPVALPGPLRRKRGGRRAIRFAPAVGCGLSAGSQEARSTRVTVVRSRRST